MNRILAGLIVIATVFLAGCGTPPKRPAFTAADNVQGFEAADIVGNWQVTILNALEGEQASSVIYTYESSGAWIVEVKQNASGMDMQVDGVGRWTVEGESLVVVVDDVQVNSSNSLVKLMSGMMKGVVEKSSGNINPYEISDNQMIWLTEHGQALQLDRI